MYIWIKASCYVCINRVSSHDGFLAEVRRHRGGRQGVKREGKDGGVDPQGILGGQAPADVVAGQRTYASGLP